MGYIGIMEKKIETTIIGYIGFRVWGLRVLGVLGYDVGPRIQGLRLAAWGDLRVRL